MFWHTLVLSGLLLVGFNLLAWRSKRLFPSVVLSGIAGLIGIFSNFSSLPLALHGFSLGLLAGILMSVPRPRIVLSSCLTTVAVYGIFSYFTVQEVKQSWTKAREDNPLESLEARLAYEKLPGRKPSPLLDGKEQRHQATLTRLSEIEGGWETWQAILRTNSLEMAHASVVRQFVESPGFGAGRQIRRPSPYGVRISFGGGFADDPSPVTVFAITLDATDAKDDYPTPPGVTAPLVASGTGSLWQMHRDGVVEFLNSEGYGYARDRDHVAGFIPHQFRKLPRSWGMDRTTALWKFERLELVSLLKHDKPGVYVSETLPRMDRVGQLTVRPLNAFESSSLPLLQNGEDLTKELKGSELQVLGSIRAGQVCLKCHDVQRGDLLGAFTYKLRRAPATP